MDVFSEADAFATLRIKRAYFLRCTKVPSQMIFRKMQAVDERESRLRIALEVAIYDILDMNVACRVTCISKSWFIGFFGVLQCLL